MVVELQLFVLDEVFAEEEDAQGDDGAREEEERRDLGAVDDFFDLRRADWQAKMRGGGSMGCGRGVKVGNDWQLTPPALARD